MVKRKHMSGAEFVRKILSEEKDLSNIILEEGFDLSGYEGFEEMQNYLKNENLEEDPVLINNSEFISIKAKGLYLPYVKGKNAHLMYADLGDADLGDADLENADLENANLGYADLWNANLRKADLRNARLRDANLGYADLWNANLENARLRNANLWNANLGNADLRNANLGCADLENADLRNAYLGYAYLGYADLENADLKNANLAGAVGLEHSLNLKHANFYQTKVTEKERRIIESLSETERFIMV